MPSLKSSLTIRALADTGRIFVRLFKRAWPLLVFMHLLEFAANQAFGFITEALRSSGREEIFVIASAACLELVFTMCWTAAWTLMIAFFVCEVSNETELARGLIRRFAGFVNQIIIEQIRSLAAVVWRVPLLIVPALVQYVRLVFVPLVVIFDSGYDRGEVDALQASRKLSKGRFLLLTFFAVTSLALPSLVMSLTQGSGSQWVWENPIGNLIGVAMTLFINTGFSIFLIAVYRRVSMMSAPC